MSLRFDEQLWLWIGLGAALVMAGFGLRWLGSMSSLRRWSAVIVRVGLVGIIAALLAGATLRRESDRMALVVVADVSGSVRRFGTDDPVALAGRVRQFIDASAAAGASAARRPDDVVGVIAFDARPAAVVAPTIGPLPDAWPTPAPTEGTDIASALRLAAGMIPDGCRARVLLISDGNQTTGDAAQAAEALRSRLGPRAFGGVDVLPIESLAGNEVYIESLDAPARVSASAAPGNAGAGTRVTLRTVLRATGPVTGTLRLLDEGRELDINGAAPGNGRVVTITPQEAGNAGGAPGRHVELVDVALDDARIHRFEAVFEPLGPTPASPGKPESPADTIADNNRARAFTLAAGKTSVLIIQGSLGDPGADGGATSGSSALAATGEDSVLARELRAAGLGVETIGAASFVPDPLTLQTFDAIILQNVPADALTRESQQLLQSFVRDMGGGLVMVGGPDSFGPGGWKGSPVEPILPVRLDQPEQLVTPAAAVVILLDNSGSMDHRVMGSKLSQMEIASEGAARAVLSMDKRDLVGVTAFSDRLETVVPLQPNKDPDRIARRIRSISADGGTNIGPALESAWKELKPVAADEKHIIVLTDGRSTDADRLPGLTAQLRKDKIRVSTIAVGDDADAQTLAEMARVGSGAFYRVIDPTTLPRVFIKAVRVVRAPLVRRETFTPALAGLGSPVAEELRAALAETPPSGPGVGVLPPLHGYVLTQARPEPGVAYDLLTPKGEPVLASWNVGLGKVAAWTSDASDWSRDWIPWEGSARLWGRLARYVARPPAQRGMDLRLAFDGDDLVVRLEALSNDAEPLEGLSVQATIFGPSGERTPLRLEPVGGGTYEARTTAPDSGTYVVTAAPTDSGVRVGAGAGPVVPVIAGASRAQGAEYRRLSTDRALLEDIARRSGGRVLAWDKPQEARLFDRQGIEPAQSRRPLWPMLAWAMLIVALLDIATRRVAWDRFIGREFGGDARARIEAALRDKGAAAAGTVGRLRQRNIATEMIASQQRPGRELSDEDAIEIVRQQAQRRHEERLAQRRSDREPAAGGSAAAAPAPIQDRSGSSAQAPAPTARNDAPTPPDQTPGGGLFEAKRRARQRMSDEER